jgi:DNA-binding HxlR family transcriptional regulator/putative sterol carrier protein
MFAKIACKVLRVATVRVRLLEMSRRSYKQYCAMARALDVIGERWTLLVVRELLTGPKRFKDLLGGLPGIGTNLLSGRLKELEGEGLVRRTTLPPPAGSAVYELTERGRELEPVLTGLARWGVGLLGEPRPGETFRPVWAVQAMKATMGPEAARWVRETYEFRVGEDVFHVRVDGGVSEPQYGPAFEPDLVLETDRATFLSLVSGRIEPADAIDAGKLDVEGDPETLARVSEIFGLSAGLPPS